MNYAIKYYTEETGNVIKVFDNRAEAEQAAINISCMGYVVSFYEWDAEAKGFMEVWS